MKIRHRQSGVELEGEFVRMGECSARGARDYFVYANSINGSEYAMTEWEDVKPEWVDVTRECEVSADGEVVMRDGRAFSRCPVGYRLRMVNRAEFVRECQGYAFIVERKG